jgi:hypothetical protein
MAKVPPITLKEVREKLDDKLYEALDFLEDMEETKQNQVRFTHRVSAFLSAADSVILMIEKHATRFARELGKEYLFTAWYEPKRDLFRMPDDARKNKKSDGSDTTWVYLRAARDDTIHIEQTDLVQLIRLRAFLVGRGHLTAKLRVEVINHESGTVTVSEAASEPPPPPEPDESKVEKDLWAFKPIELVDKGGNITDIIDPPMDDVVSICRGHVDKLITLVEECIDICERLAGNQFVGC